MKRRKLFSVALAAALAGPWASTAGAEIRIHTGTDEQARLPFWEVQSRGARIRLVQRLPDQTRAFFQARGFEPARAETIAQSCVFQTIFKNISDTNQPSPLRYDLNEWVVYVNDKTQSMKMREPWRRYWQSKQIPKPQRLAFNWALLPTQQAYQPGDYNWGMSIFDLEPGTEFQLKVVWHQYDTTHMARIENIRCAPDVHPQPED